jgi:hypothetical protein
MKREVFQERRCEWTMQPLAKAIVAQTRAWGPRNQIIIRTADELTVL